MDVRLDIVVEGIAGILFGDSDQPHSRCNAEVGGFEEAVRVAKRAAHQDIGPQPQVGGAEARRCAEELPLWNRSG
jgi:hypothetical protein